MKLILRSLAFLGLAQLASAQLVQTLPFAFTPNDAVILTFDKFDTLGGTRELLSVTISVELNKMGGSTAIDNDSNTSGNITLTHTLTGQLSVASGGVQLLDSSFSPIGGSGDLKAISSFNTSVTGTTGDDTLTFNATGLGDYASFSPAPTSITTSGVVNSIFNPNYQGAGQTFGLQFAADQSVSANGVSGLQQVFTVSNVAGNVTVAYNYQTVGVPEASVSVLGALGALGLMRRRR